MVIGGKQKIPKYHKVFQGIIFEKHRVRSKIMIFYKTTKKAANHPDNQPIFQDYKLWSDSPINNLVFKYALDDKNFLISLKPFPMDFKTITKRTKKPFYVRKIMFVGLAPRIGITNKLLNFDLCYLHSMIELKIIS